MVVGLIKRHVQRQRFKAALASYDDRIAEARAKHQPIRHIEAEKRAFVHRALASSCGEQLAKRGGSSPR